MKRVYHEGLKIWSSICHAKRSWPWYESLKSYLCVKFQILLQPSHIVTSHNDTQTWRYRIRTCTFTAIWLFLTSIECHQHYLHIISEITCTKCSHLKWHATYSLIFVFYIYSFTTSCFRFSMNINLESFRITKVLK
jgi:hypothetical protein